MSRAAWFDVAAVPAGWFSKEAQAEGFFDESLMDAPSGGAGSITGTLTASLDGVTVSASGASGHAGTASVALADVSASSSGKLGHSGTSSFTLDTLTPSGNGVTGHSGALSATLDDASAAIAGTVSTGSKSITGELAITLDGIAFSASGTTPVVEQTGGAGQNRSKRVYLERDGKILVFANASRAASYIAAEKKAETVQPIEKPASRIAPQATKQAEVKAIHQPQEIIAYDAIAALIQAFNLAQDISALIQAHEIEALMALYQKARELQDEEDIELLLLAA